MCYFKVIIIRVFSIIYYRFAISVNYLIASNYLFRNQLLILITLDYINFALKYKYLLIILAHLFSFMTFLILKSAIFEKFIHFIP